MVYMHACCHSCNTLVMDYVSHARQRLKERLQFPRLWCQSKIIRYYQSLDCVLIVAWHSCALIVGHWYLVINFLSQVCIDLEEPDPDMKVCSYVWYIKIHTHRNHWSIIIQSTDFLSCVIYLIRIQKRSRVQILRWHVKMLVLWQGELGYVCTK